MVICLLRMTLGSAKRPIKLHNSMPNHTGTRRRNTTEHLIPPQCRQWNLRSGRASSSGDLSSPIVKSSPTICSLYWPYPYAGHECSQWPPACSALHSRNSLGRADYGWRRSREMTVLVQEGAELAYTSYKHPLHGYSLSMSVWP